MPTNAVRKNFTYTLIDFYKEFRLSKKPFVKRVSEILPYRTYRGIIEGFLSAIMKKVIFENFTFMMPYSLGLQVVKARKASKKDVKIDYNRTIQLKKVVKHLNIHTFGFYYYVAWVKHYTNFKNNAYYKFSVNRDDRVMLSHHIQDTTRNAEQPSYTRI